MVVVMVMRIEGLGDASRCFRIQLQDSGSSFRVMVMVVVVMVMRIEGLGDASRRSNTLDRWRGRRMMMVMMMIVIITVMMMVMVTVMMMGMVMVMMVMMVIMVMMVMVMMVMMVTCNGEDLRIEGLGIACREIQHARPLERSAD